eukprot:6192314-Pleurochrysis_carterae.AAC.1
MRIHIYVIWLEWGDGAAASDIQRSKLSSRRHRRGHSSRKRGGGGGVERWLQRGRRREAHASS